MGPTTSEWPGPFWATNRSGTVIEFADLSAEDRGEMLLAIAGFVITPHIAKAMEVAKR
jgi:hypothetical protein